MTSNAAPAAASDQLVFESYLVHLCTGHAGHTGIAVTTQH